MGIGNMLSKYQYPFVPRSIAIWRVFSWNFKTPQITNGNLIIAVLLVESNTKLILFVTFIFAIFDFERFFRFNGFGIPHHILISSLMVPKILHHQMDL